LAQKNKRRKYRHDRRRKELSNLEKQTWPALIADVQAKAAARKTAGKV